MGLLGYFSVQLNSFAWRSIIICKGDETLADADGFWQEARGIVEEQHRKYSLYSVHLWKVLNLFAINWLIPRVQMGQRAKVFVHLAGLVCSLAGAAAALGPVLIKMGGHSVQQAQEADFKGMNTARWIAALVLYSCGVVCNVVTWKLFLKGLSHLSSLHATILTTTTNLLLSGLFGYLFFNEKLSQNWMFGSFFIIVGLIFIFVGSMDVDNKEE